MTTFKYKPGSLGHLQSIGPQPDPDAVVFDVRELGDAEGIEVIADSAEDALLETYDNVVELERDDRASTTDLTTFRATLQIGQRRGSRTRFEQVRIVVTSGEARP
jgi:hypothetical protein